MRSIWFILFLLHAGFLVQAQTIEGKVTSIVDSLPIPGTHIVNISANEMAISKENGGFLLRAEKGDTLIVSNVNFTSKQYVVGNARFVSIKMSPAEIQLEEVRVSNLPESEAEFRKRLLKMGMQEDEAFVPFGMKASAPKEKIPQSYNPEHTNSLGYALAKPVSFLVKKVSKEHKNKVKYYQTIASKETSIENAKKFNAELVKNLTGLEGDRLTDFIKFLDFDQGFISRSTEYEIAETVLKKYEEFKGLEG